jgi:hypothetical protein
VYDSFIDTEKYEKLANDYCYFNINTQILNIKFVYKLLRILFEKSDIPILCKTIITITGKYGDRGYSFTSDDYDKFSLHLTDQYKVFHSSLNCTDGSQSIRIQQKSNDEELKDGSIKLTLWTTPLVEDVMLNFYVKFIKEIEKFIMDCDGWEEIKDLLENKIFDNGDLKFGKYMKYIDVSKKRKNIKHIKHFDKKMNGYSLISIDDMSDSEIKEWCEELKFPSYICVNEIKKMNTDEFIDKYGYYDGGIPLYISKNSILNFDRVNLNESVLNKFPQLNNFKLDRVVQIKKGSANSDRYDGIQSAIENNVPYNYYITIRKPNTYNILVYDKYDNIHITITTNKKCLPRQTNDIKKNPYIVHGNEVKYSIIKEEYKQKNVHGYTNYDNDNFIEDECTLPNKYYWKTPDGWLYLYDKDKPEIFSLDIITPLPSEKVIQTNNSIAPLVNNDVLLFTNSCFKKTDNKSLRFGIRDIYQIYVIWCKTNDKKNLKTQKIFKDELEKINYKEEKSKGVDINNNPGKRGYNIMVSL